MTHRYSGLFLCCVVWAGVQAADIRVDPLAAGLNNGTSWTDARTSLTAALSVAVAGDRIWVKAGTYRLTGPRTAAFVIPAKVSMYGGFAGGELTIAERNWQDNPTILTGDIAGNDPASGVAFDFSNMSDNAYHVVRGASAARLDGFTIRGGNANSAPLGAHSLGGGVITGTDAEVANLMANGKWPGGSMTIANCVIENNSSENAGGGLFLMRADDHLFGCVVRWNRTYASDGAADAGGAFARAGQDIDGCMFIGNTAAIQPGNLSGEVATGGGITASAGAVRITDSLFVGNTADFGGAVICSWSSSSTSKHQIIGCTFFANNANSQGGAVHISGRSATTLTNCVFSNGAAGQGDEIQINEYGGFVPKLVAHNCTLPVIDDLNTDGIAMISDDYTSFSTPAFLDSASPLGVDGVPFTGDDGFQLDPFGPDVDTGRKPSGANTKTDIRGLPRISGSSADRGAYELQVVVAPG